MSVTASAAAAPLPVFTINDCAVDKRRVAEILMLPEKDPAAITTALDRFAAEEFRRANQSVDDAIATRPEVQAALGDARRALREAKGRRFWTSPAIRVENKTQDNGSTGGGPGAWFMILLLAVSLGLLGVTTTQLIIQEHIYPRLPAWAAFLVSGAVLSGFLLVPVTFVQTVALSRVVGLLRVSLSLSGIALAGYFISLLDSHAALHALWLHDNGPGGDILEAVGLKLRLDDIAGMARTISIVGEAVCAVAVKLNLDYARGLHLRYRHVPNPEWIAHGVEVTTRRNDVAFILQTLNRLDAERRAYDESMWLHRQQVHAAAHIITESWKAEMALKFAAVMRRDSSMEF